MFKKFFSFVFAALVLSSASIFAQDTDVTISEESAVDTDSVFEDANAENTSNDTNDDLLTENPVDTIEATETVEAAEIAEAAEVAETAEVGDINQSEASTEEEFSTDAEVIENADENTITEESSEPVEDDSAIEPEEESTAEVVTEPKNETEIVVDETATNDINLEDEQTELVENSLNTAFTGAAPGYVVKVSAIKASDNAPIIIEEDGFSYDSRAVITLYFENDIVFNTFYESADGLIKATFDDVPEGGYYYTIEKNGYVPYRSKIINVTSSLELPAIYLIPGDIKGNFTDIAGDGVVDVYDFIRIIRFFDPALSAKSAVVDINEDGCLDIADLALLKLHFGSEASDYH